MMKALRIQETDYVEGAAFDQELQKKLKQERIAKREAEWAERQAQREKDRRNTSPRRSRNTKRDRSPSEPRRSRTPDRKHRRTSEKRQPSPSPVKGSDKKAIAGVTAEAGVIVAVSALAEAAVTAAVGAIDAEVAVEVIAAAVEAIAEVAVGATAEVTEATALIAETAETDHHLADVNCSWLEHNPLV
ncbi:unnamed protein product [Umbelopsis ramanniana]